MKTLLLLFIGLISLNSALAQEASLHYKMEAKNMIHEGIEKSFIILAVTNNSDKELNHQGYGFTAESFSSTDTKGKKLKDSAWVSGLRREKRKEKSIIIPANGKILVMYSLDQLFKLSTNKKITVVCGLSKNLKIEIEKPK
jgi:hypothetical protein